VNGHYLAVLTILLEAALTACADAEQHSETKTGLDELLRIRLKINFALASLKACGRGRGGQHSPPPPG
jgi:hypothetical protein